ncbi:DUF1631 domain-containing protein [Simiduia sp. 21SJ11W-1]|nr:DUF1631 family protein [Simiduia sp. 21SJ11W-1]UTA47494.1 DUF1631 domain-containing protein [Simiduia sp. 21SJ11W-1]
MKNSADASVIERLKSCQKITVEASRNQFAVFAKYLAEAMSQQVSEAKTDQERSKANEALREFTENQELLERYFCGYLGEGFIKFKNKTLSTETGEEKYSGDMLSLVDNADLEETIAIASITRRHEAQVAEALWALNQRFAMLNGGEKVEDKANPVSPVQFCESMRKALRKVELDTKSKIIAYKQFDQHFMPAIGDLMGELNAYFVDAGILPNLNYVPGAQGAGAGAGAQEAPVDFVEGFDGIEDEIIAQGGALEPMPGQQAMPGQPGAGMGRIPGFTSPVSHGPAQAPNPNLPTQQYQADLVGAIRGLQSQMGAGQVHAGAPTGAAPMSGAPMAGAQPMPQGQAPGQVPQSVSDAAAQGAAVRQAVVYSNQQLVSALQNLQTQATAVTRQFMQTDDGAIEPLQPAMIAQVERDLTQRLREQSEDGAVDGEDLHTIDLVGMLFEYMLSDDNLPDSVKALLSYLHTPFLKLAFIDKDFFEETEHPARLLLNNLAEAGAQWVSNDGTSQYEIYPKIKSIVSRVLEEFKNDVRLFAELLLEFSSYTKKIARRQELMERRAMEKVQGEEKLREVKIRVNQEVRTRTDNLELPSAVLLLLLQPWSDYLAFVLLRYGDDSESWTRALSAVDDILWSIEPKEGSADRARQMDLHDSLMDVIETGFETIGYDQAKGKKLIEALVSLQKLALQSKKADPAPAPMRDKLETMAAEKAGHTDFGKDKPTPEEERMVDNLKMIEFGTWFEFESGKRLKVAWYNSKTLHYMLVDQMGKKVAMKSGLELAREMLGGTAKVIAGSTKPFFERALENIFHSLNSKAAEGKADDE